MNLFERYENGDFKKVGTKKLTWEGKNIDFNVVKMNIDELKYNVLNGRIAELDLTSSTELNTATYNDIKKTIVDASRKDMEVLGRDIGNSKLKEPLIVNMDGVIIDGNRRYTAINMLLNGEIKPFTPKDLTGVENVEVVILDADSDDKSVKILEYSIQFDNMKKSYDPISRSFDFARANKVQKISVEEIANSTGIKSSEIEKDIRSVQLMRVYLAAVGAKNSVALAIKMKLDGPIKEIASNKNKTDYFLQNQEALVDALTIANSVGADRTRTMRDIVKGHDKKNISTSPEVRDQVKKIASDIGVKEIIEQASRAETIEEKAVILSSQNSKTKLVASIGVNKIVGKLMEGKEKSSNSRKINDFLLFIKQVDIEKLSYTDKKTLSNIKELI
ncbi:MAG: ParB N-terminal domain-containing protein [Mycoplasmataceae bacterium]|nr:ParB N-terminal domain-containing protein [Mycoplasmataceae bacterium]